MKKQLLLFILIIFCDYLQAQIKPFIGVSVQTKGYSLQLGAKYKKWVGLGGYSVAPVSSTIPTLFFGNVGYEIPLSKSKKYGRTITPLLGVSYYEYYDDLKEVKSKGTTPFLGIEVGQDINDGRVFSSVSYCKGLFLGVGMKIFINK